jgi:hypothetical protein
MAAIPQGTAVAQDAAPTVEQIQTAEKAFAAGREAYKVGAYAEAAENFERADANAPNDRVLELAITSRERAGHVDRAGTLAQLATTRHPDSERLLKLAEPLITKAKAEMVTVSVTCTEPCALLQGTRMVHGDAAAERVVFLTPGKHTIRATWSNERSESKAVDGAAGGQVSLAFTAPPIPEEPVEAVGSGRGDVMRDEGAKEPPSGLPPLVFFVGAGLTAAVGGVSIWSGIDTVNNPGKDRVREECAGQGTDCALYQEGKDKELRTNILFAATGVLGAATVVIGAFFTNWSGESTASARPVKTARVTPWVGVGDGAMAGATGRF